MAKRKDGMAEPRDIESSRPSKKEETQMYHEGSRYYGKGAGKFANMPSDVEMVQYPNPYESLDNEAYPDSIEEIDSNQKFNNKQVRARRSKSMY